MKSKEKTEFRSWLPVFAVNLAVIGWLAFVLFSYFLRLKISWDIIPDVFPSRKIDFFHFFRLWAKFGYYFVLTVVFNVVAYLSGNFIIRKIKAEFLEYEEKLVSVILGFGLISFIVFLLGITGLLYMQIIWVMFIIYAALSVVFYKVKVKNAKNGKNGGSPPADKTEGTVPIFSIFYSQTKWGKYWLFVLCVYAFIVILGNLVPDTFYDSLNYHLAMPEEYLLNHRIFPIYWNLFSFMPANVEMLFTAGLVLGYDTAAKLINIGILFWILYFIYGFTDKHSHNKEAPLLAAIIFISVPITIFCAWTTQVEFGAALFNVGVFVCVFRYLGTSDYALKRKYLVLAGIFSGLTMGAKYFGIIFVSAYFPLIILNMLKHKKRMLADLLIFIAVSSAVLCPWLIRNYVYTGNPVYPMFYDKFESKIELNKQVYDTLIKEQKIKKEKPTIINSVKMFWTFTMKGHFHGLVFLLLIILPLFYFRVAVELRYALLYFLGVYVLWIANTHEARFFIAGLAVLAPVLAIYVYNAKYSSGVRNLVKLAVGVAVWSQILWVVARIGNREPFDYLWAVETKAEYLSKYTARYPSPYYEAAEFINDNAPLDAKVLVIGDARTFYIRRKAIGASVYDKNPFFLWAKKSHSGMELAENIVNNGISHILVNGGEIERNRGYDLFAWDNSSKAVIDNFWQNHLHLVFNTGELYVYEVSPKTGAGKNRNILKKFY